MGDQVKLVFPVFVQIEGSLISDSIEETLTLEEFAVLTDCYHESIPLRQCPAFAGVYSRIEESVVYQYSLYDNDYIDTLDSFRVDIVYPMDFPVASA